MVGNRCQGVAIYYPKVVFPRVEYELPMGNQIVFSDWLLSVMKEQEITQADLARMSGISTAQVARIISGGRSAGPEACKAFARVLGLDEIFVFHMAGLLTTPSDYDVTYEEWRKLLHDLSEENRQELQQIARMRLKNQRNNEMFVRLTSRLSKLAPAKQDEIIKVLDEMVKLEEFAVVD